MKNLTTSELMTLSYRRGAARSFRQLAADDTAKLVQCYLALDANQRRLRFGAGVSDGSIRRHGRGIDWTRALVIGCINLASIEAALEIHALGSDWRRAEIAFACRSLGDTVLIAGHLLQLAAFRAGRLGCEQLVVVLDNGRHPMLPLLRGMGELSINEDCASVGLGEYAALSDGPPTAVLRRAR